MSTFKHPFHMVNNSPWPITGALAALFITSGMTKWFHSSKMSLMILGMIIMFIITYQWWRDVSRESSNQGHHTKSVMVSMRWGMILFILSEIMFFLSFFWAFFHSSLSPSCEIGSQWPPTSIISFNPMMIPLLNTAVLLTSGITVTWAHHSIIENNLSQTKIAMISTIILGIYFTILQAMEYSEASFSLADSVYGSTFFVATGFHGLHVIIGTSFLAVSTIRIWNLKMSPQHHFGFEAAAWYWHFVDVVWLFLYSTIYWWAS
uniref:Cytochrome c oxidase subunit 3 n=1 Tax=Symphylella sp. YG-2006 TaxID=390856 RepID=B7S767_9MYRI|nr:cytochrome c oxidase subunit III [Symphylella sp. YG-2006]ABQ01736.1 cytochrome c oxidase subunit III [Symphylella sp. YG-2006]